MRGFITILAIVFATVAYGQVTKIDATSMPEHLRSTHTTQSIVSGAVSSQTSRRKIAVNDGERIMGFYNTDALPEMNGGYQNSGYVGTHPVADCFEGEMLERFVGGDIVRMRFAVGCSAYVQDAFIYEGHYMTNGELYIEDDATIVEPINAMIDAGWYDVELSQPVTIEQDKVYLIGFTVNETSSNKALVTDVELNVDYSSFYGYLIYMTYNDVLDWWYLGEEYGQLCIQAVVSGMPLADDDIALTNLDVPQYAFSLGTLDYSFNIANAGWNTPESYTLAFAIDGTVVETLATPLALSPETQTLTGSIDMGGVAEGNHTLTITVADINGNTPTVYTFDDTLEASFYVYPGTPAERQMQLIEHFTSIYCVNCPYGHDVLQKLCDANPGKYAWVSMHTIGMGADPYALNSSQYYNIELFSDAYYMGYPSAVFSRAQLTSSYLQVARQMAILIGYQPTYQSAAATAIDNAIDDFYATIPPYVTVDITVDSYDAATRTLTCTVSGNGNEYAKQYLSSAQLTGYLVEDGIEGQQLGYSDSGYQTTLTYTHNNVLRNFLTYYDWGEDISWTSDSSYSNTFTTTLGSGWDPNNISIVAFISGPMVANGGTEWAPERTAYVYNANKVKMIPGDEASQEDGIAAVDNAADLVQQAVYTLDGRAISTPQRGINIIRMSDGTVKKVISR